MTVCLKLQCVAPAVLDVAKAVMSLSTAAAVTEASARTTIGSSIVLHAISATVARVRRNGATCVIDSVTKDARAMTVGH